MSEGKRFTDWNGSTESSVGLKNPHPAAPWPQNAGLSDHLSLSISRCFLQRLLYLGAAGGFGKQLAGLHKPFGLNTLRIAA